MRQNFTEKRNVYLLFFLLLILFSSCASTKNTKYFQDIPDSGRLGGIPKASFTEPKIQNDDILTVVVQTVDPQATAMINSGNVSSAANNATGNVMPASSASNLSFATPNINSPAGYLVDKEGTITIPVLGKIKVAGLTTTEARELIRTTAEKFYNNPSITVRYANFKVNVGGEVLKPGSYIMPNEKVSVLDAITMAGDLTIYGKRENVLLIRENLDGTRTPYRINLKKSDFMSSPYFYLKQNDYIYVEPSKGKAAATDMAQARNYTIAGSILSIIAIILTRK
ncbi:polysaccharide biosynthesis/export family protein [Mucilaginibacter sp. BT774]|uniref:polysaccharide biosynthesis/export family protein n=1 Tax=Mucilaginibacter sp. BT774 TaxID=3062276 RepID=UPI0026762AA6|nr:polysaccharide biosynthesis/export family protein [Mucilaginibacter sp. BT774]MDO3628843.1 polysaccharide biosynthesis/export family protein [Mucilaginibacter sp. BT774]